jgi:hypothetical protein
MKLLIVFLLILSLLAPLSVASAQAPSIGSKEDNACNPGGSMAGKCTTEWQWRCGWFLARWEANGGWFTLGNALDGQCLSLLPPAPITPQDALALNVGPICILTFGGIIQFCILGNRASHDFLGSPQSPDLDYLIIPSFPCPAPFTDGVFGVSSLAPEARALANSLGFPDSDIVCSNALP